VVLVALGDPLLEATHKELSEQYPRVTFRKVHRARGFAAVCGLGGSIAWMILHSVCCRLGCALSHLACMLPLLLSLRGPERQACPVVANSVPVACGRLA
jgi:hypothetical protein